MFTDPPSAPGKPEIVDYDKDHVDLKWAPPKSDGGAPIKKYVIEKKPKFGDWEKVIVGQANCVMRDFMK